MCKRIFRFKLKLSIYCPKFHIFTKLVFLSKIFVLHVSSGKSDGHLSNTLAIPMPLNVEHIRVSDEKDVKRVPYLMVKEGNGKPPGKLIPCRG